MTTQTEKNRAIHEWMGECWHEWEVLEDELEQQFNFFPKCLQCGYKLFSMTGMNMIDHNPDYFTPRGFFKVKEWLVEDNDEVRPLRYSFIAWMNAPAGMERYIVFLLGNTDYHFSNPDSLPNRLYAWIKENE